MCSVCDPSESFCQFKHSLMILIRPSESLTLRWDSMKTSQITEEYGTVLIIAQRGQTSLQGWSYCLFTSLYPSKCRECGFFLELKIRFKKRKMYYWRYYLQLTLVPQENFPKTVLKWLIYTLYPKFTITSSKLRFFLMQNAFFLLNTTISVHFL